MADFVGAVDQGTTSTRFMIFDHGGNEVARHQLEHEQILPQAGWVEHNPIEIWERTTAGHPDRAQQGQPARRRTSPRSASPTSARPPWSGTGSTGRPLLQRDRLAGHPHRPHRLRARARRARATSSAARPACRRRPTSPAARSSGSWRTSTGCGRPPRSGDAIFGNTDTLAAVEPHRRRRRRRPRHRPDQRQPHDADGPRDARLGRRAARRSSTSRGDAAARSSRRPTRRLRRRPGPTGPSAARCRSPATSATSRRPPSARSASRPARPRTPTAPATSCCSTPAPSSSAPRTACSRRSATSSATRPPSTRWRARSRSPARPCSGCATSSASSPAPRESESLARQVEDNGGVYFVPAFSGLFAPYWRSDARGAIVGLSRFNTNAHLARATLESICYQSRDVVEAMAAGLRGDASTCCKVDGGVTANELCMQIQADILGVPVSRPVVAETTALGAAYAAGLAVGFWSNTDELRENWNEDKRWEPAVDRRAARGGLRRLEEGRRADARLGRRGLSPAPDAAHDRITTRRGPTMMPSPCRRRTALQALARWQPTSSTSSSSAAAWSAPAPRSTPSPAACPSALVEARDFASGTSSRSSKLIHGGLRYLEMLDFGLVARGAAGARPAARDGSPRTWCGRCRSSTRCSTGSGSGSTSAPGVALYDTMALSGRARGVPHHRHLTRARRSRMAPVAAQGRARRRDPVLRRPGRRRAAHDDRSPAPRPRTARTCASRARVDRVPARGRAGRRRAWCSDLETGRDDRASAPGR